MKLAVIGATGTIGQRIVKEALTRGHAITGIARNPSRLAEVGPGIAAVEADATNVEPLEAAIGAHDAVISAVGPNAGSDPSVVLEVSRALAAAAMRAAVRRVVIVGGAGSLSVKPGLELLATPEFPEAWKPVALAHREALELWRRVKELDWTYLSPAAVITPGTRTGRYRVGHDDLLVDAKGESKISTEDFAAAVIDALEHKDHIRERITVAY
jgi:putative NADH-flavin reductase